MKLIDLNSEQILTLSDLKNDWSILKKEDPQNHANTFKRELFEILMDTVNGRNDLDIIGLTADETEKIICKIRKDIGR